MRYVLKLVKGCFLNGICNITVLLGNVRANEEQQ